MSQRAIDLAASLREELQLTHPPVASGIVHLCGVRIIVKVTALRPGIAGVLYHEGWKDAVIWLEESDPLPRRRWSLIHELGHLFLHPFTYYCAAKTPMQRATEREADAFTAAMLMPEPWIRRDVSDGWRDPARLARRYDVSFTAMDWRLRELGVKHAG